MMTTLAAGKTDKIYYGSWLGDFSEGSSYELLEYWISYYRQDSSAEEDRLAGGNEWAVSFVNRIGEGPWALHSTLGVWRQWRSDKP